MENIYHFTATTIDGKQKSLAEYQGKVLLIVNTASHCGFTPQYQQLQALYSRYSTNGFAVLGFPCNQFNGQEPDENQKIAQFCQLNYDVSFPLFAKINVNGDNTEPLFVYLKSTCPGLFGSQVIKWNFTKFLVDNTGVPVKRYAPIITPNMITKDIEWKLAL